MNLATSAGSGPSHTMKQSNIHLFLKIVSPLLLIKCSPSFHSQALNRIVNTEFLCFFTPIPPSQHHLLALLFNVLLELLLERSPVTSYLIHIFRFSYLMTFQHLMAPDHITIKFSLFLPSVTLNATFWHFFMLFFCLLMKIFRLSKVPSLAPLPFHAKWEFLSLFF